MPEAEKQAEERKKELLAHGEISIILDRYEDIFSDFDPRPYSHRSLSDDFLQAARKAVPQSDTEHLELRFMIPKAERKHEEEALIKKRLHEHFRKHALMLEKERGELTRRGAVMTLIGTIILMLATYIISLERNTLLHSLLIVILEPAGWFTSWTGLETIFLRTKEKKPELEFYTKMSKSEIVFIEY